MYQCWPLETDSLKFKMNKVFFVGKMKVNFTSVSIFYPSLDRLGLIPACIFFQHDDDDDPEDISTEDLPIGKSSVGVLGA